MDKTRILGIAPYDGIKALMLQAAEYRSDIELTAFAGDLNEGLSIASRYTLNDFDIIVSRGGTAELIRNNCSIPVVEINISAMDILRSIRLAHNVSNKYALVGFPSITKSAQLMCDLLQYNIEIYTIHNRSEAEEVLAELTKKGLNMILCDMITYSLAQTLGLTAILITSGLESIKDAFDEALETKRTYDYLTRDVVFFRNILENHPHNFFVYNEACELIYKTKYDSLPDIIIQEMKDKVPILLEENTLRVNKVAFGVLYVINGVYKTINKKAYIVYYISSSKVPLSIIKDGIQYLNKDDVINKLFNSFYGITQPVMFSDSFIKQYADGGYPVMIIGEEGTGREHLAYVLYVKSRFSNYPFVVLDCIRFTSKSWSFLTDDSISPLSDTSTTIYIKNMELLSHQQFDELFSIIHDLKLYTKNRLIFIFTSSSKDSTIKRCTQIINHFFCHTIRVPALRDRIEQLPDLSSIYISNLNVSLAREVLGFDAEALAVMKSYDWPGNYNQFKKIISELVANTDSSYITASSVTKLLQKEVRSHLSDSDFIELSLIDKTLEDINLYIVEQVLRAENGNQSATAKRLGISRTTLWRMLQKISLSD